VLIGTIAGALLGSAYGMLWGPIGGLIGCIVGTVFGAAFGCVETLIVVAIASPQLGICFHPRRYFTSVIVLDGIVTCIPAAFLRPAFTGSDGGREWAVFVAVPTVVALITSVVAAWMLTDRWPGTREQA